jgi:ABC-type uncharacterized transport system fused permease/ATPase subunit
MARYVTLNIDEESEMASLTEGSHVLVEGSDTDFQPAVLKFKDGTVHDFATDWSSNGPAFVADMVAKFLQATVITNRNWTYE